MKYKFEITSKETGEIEVEADTLEQAREKAEECDGVVLWGDVETEVIKQI